MGSSDGLLLNRGMRLAERSAKGQLPLRRIAPDARAGNSNGVARGESVSE